MYDDFLRHFLALCAALRERSDVLSSQSGPDPAVSNSKPFPTFVGEKKKDMMRTLEER